jgi:hypothetical protein
LGLGLKIANLRIGERKHGPRVFDSAWEGEHVSPATEAKCDGLDILLDAEAQEARVGTM